ncbi:uncharacterized protein RBU33_014520 [Hipposideros larvatus]
MTRARPSLSDFKENHQPTDGVWSTLSSLEEEERQTPTSRRRSDLLKVTQLVAVTPRGSFFLHSSLSLSILNKVNPFPLEKFTDSWTKGFTPLRCEYIHQVHC